MFHHQPIQYAHNACAPRAHQLYVRLGYIPLQAQPYHNRWRFTDSDGRLHKGEEWLIDMRKKLD